MTSGAAGATAPAPAAASPISLDRHGRFALAGVLVLAAVLGAMPLSHDDLFWHLRAGARMVAGHAVLHTDPFSFTRAGAPWVTHEWGFSVLVWAVDRIGGLSGLIVFRSFLVVALMALVLAAARRRVPPAAAQWALPLLPAVGALALWSVSRLLILRAALVGALPFALLALWLLPAFQRRPDARRGAAVAATVLVWANLHSGVVFGLLLVGLVTLEALVRRRDALAHLGLAAVALLAALANPNGIAALAYPFRIARLLADPESGFTLGHFAGGWHGREAILGLLVLYVLAGVLGELRSGRRRLPAPWELAALAIFAVLSWTSSRLGVELAVLAVPAVFALWAPRLAEGAPVPETGTQAPQRAGAEGGAAAARPALRSPGCGLRVLAAFTWGASLMLAAGVWSERAPGLLSPAFPAGAADFLAAQGIRGRMFNHQNWGGYLGWRLDEPVFWDGRNLLFAPLVREVTTTPFVEVARRHHVDHLVLSPRELDDLAPELASGRWVPVYADGQAAVLLRRGAFPAVVARLARQRGGAAGPAPDAAAPEAPR